MAVSRAHRISVDGLRNSRSSTRPNSASVQPNHRDERGEQGDQKTRVHETGGGDDLALWISLDGWNGGGLTWDGGLIESEADGAENGSRLLVGIGLEI